MFSNSSAERLLGARRHIGDRGKLLVGVDRLADALQLAVALDQRDPFAQIAPAHLRAHPAGRQRVDGRLYRVMPGFPAMRCSMDAAQVLA